MTKDYRDSLYLPKTDFAMRANLPVREVDILARWEKINLYRRQRAASKGRKTFLLHDGPPYANGHIHLGSALNKILKDMVVRAMQAQGYDANYVPGWDCHGLPIEWKVEERLRESGLEKDKIEISRFRRDCRAFAEKWIDIQREEFKRLGVVGDWDQPYTTMAFEAEALIASELLTFRDNGSLYRGSKPVMWSVVERTALAEAEVEYKEVRSRAITVAFPLKAPPRGLDGARLLIWTTTPWTIPANRAIAYNPSIDYGLFEVTGAGEGTWAKVGDRFVLASRVADEIFALARVDHFKPLAQGLSLEGLIALHPFHGEGYDFDVPVLKGDFVDDLSGTGLVHIAPGHGRDDFILWNQEVGAPVPDTVGDDGRYLSHIPLFAGKAVLDARGRAGDATPAVCDSLRERGTLIASQTHVHDYPHSWRSKAPVIFRNTPQWFISMTEGIGLRERALQAIDATRFVPEAGAARLRSMVAERPDWVISRQRAWGVPIILFLRKDTGEVLCDKRVDARILKSFAEEGADAWFADDACARFLAPDHDPEAFDQVRDILDVWFDSGSTHRFVLQERSDLYRPAELYLEGSDQHRGWFQSSLLQGCGTVGRAPFTAVLTHGFVVDESGRKMSKSLQNALSPDSVVKRYGAEILRLWVSSVNYSDDLRFSEKALGATTEAYRKLRNTLRWMLGNLAHYDGKPLPPYTSLESLEKWILHRTFSLEKSVREAADDFDFKRVFHEAVNFANLDLSAFYFDVRKDALYCDPPSSTKRQASLAVLDLIFSRLLHTLSPILCFTTEEAWLARFPKRRDMEGSVHLTTPDPSPEAWYNPSLARRWVSLRRVRRCVTAALEQSRRAGLIGSSLEAQVRVSVEDESVWKAVRDDLSAELCITSDLTLHHEAPRGDDFRLDGFDGIGVSVSKSRGKKCARSWIISDEIGSDSRWPDLSPRDAQAMEEKARR